VTTEILIQPVLPAGVERRVSPRGMTAWRRPVRGMLTRPGLRLVASTTLRNLLLITVAMLLIFVLLPALLSAQWASVG
jgi:hypothetical protein